MNTPYREAQYFHPLFYAGSGGGGVILLAIAMVGVPAGGSSTAGMISAGVGVLLLLGLAAIGRMVVTVDGEKLTITFGWLGVVRRSLVLATLDRIRVCVLSPVATYLGWGWRYGLDGSTCYTTRGRRGVEIIAGGRRSLVGSQNPQLLKLALMSSSEPADDRPEYQREILKLPKRRRGSDSIYWGLLNPEEMRARSA